MFVFGGALGLRKIKWGGCQALGKPLEGSPFWFSNCLFIIATITTERKRLQSSLGYFLSKLHLSTFYIWMRGIIFYVFKSARGSCVYKPRCCCALLSFFESLERITEKDASDNCLPGHLHKRKEGFLKSIKDDSLLLVMHMSCFIT